MSVFVPQSFRLLPLLLLMLPTSLRAQAPEAPPFQLRAGIGLGAGESTFTQTQAALARKATLRSPVSTGVSADLGFRYSHFFFEFSVFWLNNTFEQDLVSPQLLPTLGLEPGINTGLVWDTQLGSCSLGLGLEKGSYFTAASDESSWGLAWGGTAFEVGAEFEWNREFFSQSWLRPGLKLEYRYFWIRTDEGGTLPSSVESHAHIYWAGLTLNLWDRL